MLDSEIPICFMQLPHTAERFLFLAFLQEDVLHQALQNSSNTTCAVASTSEKVCCGAIGEDKNENENKNENTNTNTNTKMSRRGRMIAILGSTSRIMYTMKRLKARSTQA
eukprot:COSAG02_NODE_3858_length_6134_cov_6.287016_11_plen_109_part_01